MPLANTDLFTDTRLWLYSGDRVARAMITDWKDLECDLNPFEQGTLTVTAHKSSQLCQAANANSDTALAVDWGWTDTTNKDNLWSLDFYYRGTLIFSGPIVVVKKYDEGFEGTAYVTLVAETWYQHFGRRRQVRTETGIQWSATNEEIGDIFLQLWREQWDPDDIVTPTGSGNRQAYTATETRDDAGPNWTVEVAADDNTGTQIDWKCDDKTNLLDATNELCYSTAADTDWLWPTCTESPVGTWTIGRLHARSGGGRAIGSDLTSTVTFTTYRGNLPAFSKELDGSATTNLWTVTGTGRGSSQRCRHIADSTSCDVLGVYEDSLNIPQGGTNDECDYEAQRLINERKQGWITWDVTVVETSDTEYPADWNIGDDVSVYDSYFGEGIAQMVIGVRVSASAPGPFVVRPKFGRIQRHPLRELGRSGGGGGGGRSGGGRPRQKHGESETDPDDLPTVAWTTFTGQSGGPATADTATDTCAFSGKENATYVRAFTYIEDDTEAVKIDVVADPNSGGDTQNCYVVIKDASGGNDIYLLAYQLGYGT